MRTLNNFLIPNQIIVCICLSLHIGGVSGAEISRRPNIIVIMADDLGYGDTSVYDGWIQTPSLQRMADEGLTFTDFHTNSSVCSPTRAAFLTGRYQQRVGIVDVIVGNRDKHGLSIDQMTISRKMRHHGYKTALFGKWHLGQQAQFNPIHHGFDEYIGYLIGAADYHNHKDWYDGVNKKSQQGYTTHLITENSIRFIQENSKQSFFLFVAHEAVHLPFQTPQDTPEKRKPVPKEERWSRKRIRPKYKVMLEEMDKGIGKILDTLVEEKIADNTLVFFLSDNGAISAGSNKPFRGGKFSHYEGGHRVPAIAWWPGRIVSNSKTDELAIGTDLMPTFLDLSGIPFDKSYFDGISLKELLLQQETLPDRKLFFGYEPKLGTAMRDRNWKMIVSEKRGVELYNLNQDIGEKNNLADQFPDRVRMMQDAITSWKKEMGKVEPEKAKHP